VIANTAHARRHGEGHGDIVVERGFVVSVAQVAMEVVLNSAQAPEVCNDVGAQRAVDQSVHLDEAGKRRVKKEVDGLVLGHAALDGERDRIDAEQRLVPCRADQGFPALRLLELGETFLQNVLVDHALRSCRGGSGERRRPPVAGSTL